MKIIINKICFSEFRKQCMYIHNVYSVKKKIRAMRKGQQLLDFLHGQHYEFIFLLILSRISNYIK